VKRNTFLASFNLPVCRVRLFLLFIFAVFVFSALGPVSAIGREPSIRPSQQVSPEVRAYPVELELDYAFSIPGQTTYIVFVVALPRSMEGRQKIQKITYSQEPSRIFYENGNRYAQFLFEHPADKITLMINIQAELYEYDLAVAKRKRNSEAAGLEEFLKSENFIDKENPALVAAAKKIKGESDIDKVRNIYKYVIDNLDYSVLSIEDLGAVAALERKKGDCTEYSDLFVALCRAKGIPARVVTGYTARFDGISPKHHWAEVYLKKFGWVPFDASWGDVKEPVTRKMAFERLQPVYLYVSFIRNDPMLYNKHFFAYSYWGDKPIMSDSARFKHVCESR